MNPDKDDIQKKEFFRLWHECLRRTCKYWVYVGFLGRKRYSGKWKQKSCCMAKYFLDNAPSSIELYDEEKSYVDKMFSDMCSMAFFIPIEFYTFDQVWGESSPEMKFVKSWNDVEPVENIIRDTAKWDKESVGDIGFDGWNSDLLDYISNSPLFREDGMRLNISIYPFGKTKKEILDEVWHMISSFKSNKKKIERHKDEFCRWTSQYMEIRPSEIKRYIGVFDLYEMKKTRKDIILMRFDKHENEFIEEVSKFYSARLQTANGDMTDCKRSISRDYKKSKELILNAVDGYFPKYKA